MIIHVDNVNVSSLSGPNTFARRLAQQLMCMGHKVIVGDGTDADVSLVFIEPTGQPLARRVVQRIDGIWFSPNEFYAKNCAIKALYDRADHIIFQSNFDKTLITKWWNEPVNSSVINNGTNILLAAIIHPTLIKIRNHFDKVFVCSSNWHGQKRLCDNIKMFKHLRNFYDNSCLIIMGNNAPNIIEPNRIFCTGHVKHEVYMQVYAMSDWMIHLEWLGHCPNVVIEALSQNTPVICSNVGGVKELIGNYGLVLNEEQQYNYELVDYENPPMIDVTQVTYLPDRDQLSKNMIADINIVNVANKYVKVLEATIT